MRMLVRMRVRVLGAGGADAGDAGNAQADASGRAFELVDRGQALHAAGVDVRFVIVGRVHVGQSAAQATPAAAAAGGGGGGAGSLITGIDGGTLGVVQRVGAQRGRGRERLHFPHLLLADVVVVVLWGLKRWDFA